MEEQELGRLQAKAREIRKAVIQAIGSLGIGHIGGSMSIVETLVILYYKFMNIDPADPNSNVNLAKAIVRYRNANGPFKTIFDLYKVPEVQTAVQNIINATDAPRDLEGHVTPSLSSPSASAQGGDGVRKDFEDRFLFLTRISNMITTRSDTFTCYLMVQGWRNVGTQAPERMEIVAGAGEVRLDGATAWKTYEQGMYFDVPRNSGFTIRVRRGLTEYVCSFG